MQSGSVFLPTQNTMKVINGFFVDEFQAEICEIVHIIYSLSHRIQCNGKDVESILACYKDTTRNIHFDQLDGIQASSYLLWISLYNILDPSAHHQYIDPRNDHKLGTNKALEDDGVSSNTQKNISVREMLNTTNNMTRDASHNKQFKISQQASAQFLRLIINLILKSDAKVKQTTVCPIYSDIDLMQYLPL